MREIVKRTVNEYDPSKLFSISVQKQMLMEECIRLNGRHDYKKNHTLVFSTISGTLRTFQIKMCCLATIRYQINNLQFLPCFLPFITQQVYMSPKWQGKLRIRFLHVSLA